MKDYITTFTLTTYLYTEETTNNLIVYMVTQERIGSPEAVVIYFASITYHLQKALPINHSPITALLSLHATRRIGA